MTRSCGHASEAAEGLTDRGGSRRVRQSNDGRRFVQTLVPFGVGVGVGGDPAADSEHGVADGVELDGPDRDVELASCDGRR